MPTYSRLVDLLTNIRNFSSHRTSYSMQHHLSPWVKNGFIQYTGPSPISKVLDWHVICATHKFLFFIGVVIIIG